MQSCLVLSTIQVALKSLILKIIYISGTSKNKSRNLPLLLYHLLFTVDSNDITVLVSGEQNHYFHMWGLQKPLVAFATRLKFIVIVF
jgi:hypothetical protein